MPFADAARLEALEQAEALLKVQQDKFERTLHEAGREQELFAERQRARDAMAPTTALITMVVS